MLRVLLLLFSLVWVGNAHATITLEDQGKARARCEADKAALLKAVPGALPGNTGRDCTVEGESGTPRTFTCEYQGPSPRWCGTYATPPVTEKWYTYPAGKTCANRLKTPSGYINSATASTVCHDGCTYTLQDATEDHTLRDVQQNAINTKRGRYAPTGATCGLPTDTVKPPYSDDFCQDLGGGYKQCRKPGKTCVVNVAKKEFCWADGVSGPSTDPKREDAAVKSPDAPAPGIPTTPPAPRTGEDWQPNGPSSSITNNTTNTTNNYTNFSNLGTPNTTPGSGTPGDGSDNPAGEEGDEEDDGSASGGGTCEAPPVCSGDAINCAILDQTWRNRCQDGGDANGDGQPDWTEGEAPGIEDDGNSGAGVSDTRRFGIPVGTSSLDGEDLFGGGSCPAFSMIFMGKEASTADIPAWCDRVLPTLRAIIMIFGALAAVRILMGANE